MLFKKLWPLVLSATALGINSYVIAGILPDIASSLHVSQGSVGLGVATFTAAYALSAPWLPGVLTRTGTTRRALLIALAVFTVGSAITAASPSLGVFLAARAVAGAGAGALTALATGAAGVMLPGRRGAAMAMVTFGLSLGTVAGVPIGMLIAGRIGWRATIGLIVVLALIGLAAIAARGAMIPPLAAAPQAAADSAATGHATRVLAGGVVLAFLLGIGSLGLYTYLMPIAADAGHSWPRVRSGVGVGHRRGARLLERGQGPQSGRWRTPAAGRARSAHGRVPAALAHPQSGAVDRGGARLGRGGLGVGGHRARRRSPACGPADRLRSSPG
ncbi:MAG: MFS transporter [Acidipropionibacterium sp.]|nr:MFS transporter [Acidipropionibacterium sp.]